MCLSIAGRTLCCINLLLLVVGLYTTHTFAFNFFIINTAAGLCCSGASLQRSWTDFGIVVRFRSNFIFFLENSRGQQAIETNLPLSDRDQGGSFIKLRMGKVAACG